MSATGIWKTTPHKSHIVVGLILIAAGIFINQRSLAVFAIDGEIVSTKNLIVIWTFQLLCIVAGGSFIIFRSRDALNSTLARFFSWWVITVFGFVAFSISMFAVFEVFPTLVPNILERYHLYYSGKSRFEFDAELGYRFKPNYQMNVTYFGDMYSPTIGFEPESITFHVSHDEHGHHNPEVPSSPDIAMLGDSWLWIGHDWSDTFSARLEKLSGRITYNLGVNGYGPHQYLVAFKRYAADLKPKVTLFCFYEGNDIEDVAEYLSWKASGQPLGFHGYIARLSQTGFFDRFANANLLTLSAINTILSPPPFQGSVVELPMAEDTIKAGFFFRSDPRPANELLETSEWQELKKVLAEFKRTSLAVGSLPVLVFLPSKQHVYAKHTGNGSDEKWLAMREQEIASENHREEAFALLAEHLQMKLISLTPALEARAGNGEMLYYPFDSHWNSTARALAAEIVAGQLQKTFDSETSQDRNPP